MTFLHCSINTCFCSMGFYSNVFAFYFFFVENEAATLNGRFNLFFFDLVVQINEYYVFLLIINSILFFIMIFIYVINIYKIKSNCAKYYNFFFYILILNFFFFCFSVFSQYFYKLYYFFCITTTYIQYFF